LETDDPIARAAEKLKRKNLDMIVANTPATFGSSRISCTILSKEGARLDLEEVSKEEFSAKLAELIKERVRSSLNREGPES
jgi:phosphopantothenoylcysteine synthetase/decarboxylase